MNAKIIVPKGLCDMDAIKFVARRHATTTESVVSHYFIQTGILKSAGHTDAHDYELAPNELALLCDLGVQPSEVEIR